MKRRDFLGKAAASAILLNNLSILDVFASTGNRRTLRTDYPFLPQDLAKPSKLLTEQFNGLSTWLNDNKWGDFLNKELRLNDIDLTKMTDEQLCAPLSNITTINQAKGIDDFAGNRLIEPGEPARSLLYHVLASPRVQPGLVKAYPDIEQLDILENYIYALKPLDAYNLKKGVSFLAVLAYEYRPAFKVPTLDPNDANFTRAADLVFSRCGVARIGNQAFNYDAQNRCFINAPKEGTDQKHIAVTAARYGLFVVELVEVVQDSQDPIKVMNYQKKELTKFIRPIRKVFNDDVMEVHFSEYHVNEKLGKLAEFEANGQPIKLSDSHFKRDKAPFKRISCTNDQDNADERHATDVPMVKLLRRGSSILLIPQPADLIRVAKQDNKLIGFEVPPQWKENHLSNRRYSAFKATDLTSEEVTDAIITDVEYRRHRLTSRFGSPKNAPLFANIKFQNVKAPSSDPSKLQTVTNHIGPGTPGFDAQIKAGGYYAQLFEDSISDGCIAAKVVILGKNPLTEQLATLGEPMAAASLVTAPDFFPYLDNNDVRAYYFNEHFGQQKLNVDEDFLEGGTINLSGIRLRGNPMIINPFTRLPAFEASFSGNASYNTLTAVLAANTKTHNEQYKANSHRKFRLSYNRDYRSTSFLPDTGTGIFFPGWEATYSSQDGNIFLATIGLGSPFPEDMKLCAAANGMWPVSSPDAGRTFQGSLEKFPLLGRPSTSIPLMDREIGIHSQSAAHKEHSLPVSYGWDGEQGPYLAITRAGIVVNFTDINRADYVANLLDPLVGFDMSQLRNLESTELIQRMDCLRKCIRAIENNQVQHTKLWLVGAEQVNWQPKANCAIHCVPSKLIQGYTRWGYNETLKGRGYLYLFVKHRENQPMHWDGDNSKRRWLPCDVVYVCQVTPQAVSICTIPASQIPTATNVRWKNV